MLDDGVLSSIVEAAGVQPGDLVLEIGPGEWWQQLVGGSAVPIQWGRAQGWLDTGFSHPCMDE